ncbi:hypothetical protein [Rhodococcus sp. X156]|uniref:hypothetical protein n=1 Tax=Rhodococcus sp. X156 TaxID=2499145 RepID=UPI000FDB8A9B|nr:hypothetical protein [Rhodococcus sp. X156]
MNIVAGTEIPTVRTRAEQHNALHLVELRHQASQLRQEARQLRRQARALRRQARQLNRAPWLGAVGRLG